MDKTNTIFFTIDKKAPAEEMLLAAAFVARTSRMTLNFVQTDDSGHLMEGGMDAAVTYFKQQGLELNLVKQSGNLWSAMRKVCDKEKAGLAIVGAEVSPMGLMGLGGGMSSKVDGFECPVLYLTDRTKWQTPNTILMPLDSNSETRQKFTPVAKWAKLLYSKVLVFGVRTADSGEEKSRNQIYAVQGNNYMVERGINVDMLDYRIGPDLAKEVLSVASNYSNSWLAVLSNKDRAIGAGSFQLVCEKTNMPLMVIPYTEAGVAGGSGY